MTLFELWLVTTAIPGLQQAGFICGIIGAFTLVFFMVLFTLFSSHDDTQKQAKQVKTQIKPLMIITLVSITLMVLLPTEQQITTITQMYSSSVE